MQYLSIILICEKTKVVSKWRRKDFSFKRGMVGKSGFERGLSTGGRGGTIVIDSEILK